MANGKQLQPIIIKRVKKGGHAAHGGAWKIAYADFVTAMMAFFLLMWLLGSTTEGDKKTLIVTPTVPLSAGEYKVEWHAVSVDTHKSEGAYQFKVGQ